MNLSAKVILGCVAFAVFWVLAVFPAVPFFPIGRTAGSLLGALLMVVFQVMDSTEAYDAIDLQILALLFGTMVVSVYLERADMFKYLGRLLAWNSKGAKDLICRISIISAVLSALFTNDTSCMVLTEFVLRVAQQKNLPPHPFLLALASSANIGSSATPIGNPQNLVIAVESGIFTFGSFVMGILPAMLVGLVTNLLILLVMYWKLLSFHKEDEDRIPEVDIVGEDANLHRFSPTTMSHVLTEIVQANGNRDHTNALDVRNHVVSGAAQADTTPLIAHEIALYNVEVSCTNASTEWKRIMWKTCVYLVTVGMLVALLMGLNMSWTAVGAALALIVLDFRDARPSLEKVSYSLLIFFCGMFMTVEGFKRTGVPSLLWDYTESYARVDSTGGITVLALVILVLSNTISNVPTVLLLGTKLAESAGAISTDDVRKAWLILAWVSTVAGNLSLLGSAANLIVCEQARRSPHGAYDLSFWCHLKFGVPSTIAVTAIGLTLINWND